MALLNILPPLVSETQPNFNQQTYQGFNAIQAWQSLILSTQDVDYTQSVNNNAQSNNFTTNSNSYQTIPNFTFNFTPKNKLSLVSMSLTLNGTGYVGLFINDLLALEIPFNNITFNQVGVSRQQILSTSSNKISLAMKSQSGSVTMACAKIQPFLNYMQITDINS